MQLHKNDSLLFPDIEPFDVQLIPCSPLHQIYVEQSGNPKGLPVIFLHGGPGGRCHAADRRYFDPKTYRIILFDQRGSGNSLPFCELKDNTTWHLVDDIELIRKSLKIERWILFGGSWGSTLALAYLSKYSQHVYHSVLRGIFLGGKEDLDWFYEGFGANALFPDAYEKFLKPLNQKVPGNIIAEYYKILSNPKDPQHEAAIEAWSNWEGETLGLETEDEVKKSFLKKQTSRSIAIIESHYFHHKNFLKEKGLAEDLVRLQNKPPLDIVHGRYDVICPLRSAWKLHKCYEGSKLHICEASGHTASERRITEKLLEIMEKLKSELS